MWILDANSVLALAAFLVVLGFGLLLAADYMRRQARQVSCQMDELLRLAQQHEDDPLAFVPESLSLLYRSGAGYIHVQVRWFGQTMMFGDRDTHQVSKKRCEARTLGSGEIEARVLVCARHGLRGEQRMRFEMVCRLWLSLLASQINGRLAQLHLSEQQLRRYELFYKHDLKNLAQFMTLLNAQVRQCRTPMAASRLVERMQHVLPALEKRAGRILSHLEHRQRDEWDAVDAVSLAERIRMIAAELELEAQVEGDMRVMVSASALDQGLQNILENFAQHARYRQLQVRIFHDRGDVAVVFTAEHMRGGLSEEQRARMFEPFWTTSDSGMGLGLYIARQSIRQACAGTLDAEILNPETGQWGFVVRCAGGVSARSEDSAPPSPDSPAHPPE